MRKLTRKWLVLIGISIIIGLLILFQFPYLGLMLKGFVLPNRYAFVGNASFEELTKNVAPLPIDNAKEALYYAVKQEGVFTSLRQEENERGPKKWHVFSTKE